MKKLIVLLVCTLLVNIFVVSIGNTGASVDASEITTPAKYHWSFDDASGLTAVRQGGKSAGSVNDGATYDIIESDDNLIFSNGPVGQCLYLDGSHGVKLDVEALNTDAYSISFWINARRLNTYGPTLTLGRNMGDSGDDRTVTWFNFTQSEWGTNGSKLFPVAWNRNSSTGVWPWISAGDDKVHGLREWVMVTLVTDGERYTCADDGMDRIGTKLYLDGKLVFDASAANGFYQGVSPEILTGDGIEAYLGVNYWDPYFRGFIDELYIFDYSLTDAQVESLFAEGDKAVDSYVPDAEKDKPFELPEIVPDENAIDQIGLIDRSTGWWTDWSNAYKLEDGATATVKFRNYSNMKNNWHNYLVGFNNKPTVADIDPNTQFTDINYVDPYVEYGMVRSDSWGWGNEYEANYHHSWTFWGSWLYNMTDADVTLKITRNGNEIIVNATSKSFLGNEYYNTTKFTSSLTAEDPCYFFLTAEGSYLELLSVEGATLPTEEDIEEATKLKEREPIVVANAIDYIGTSDLTTAFFGDQSDHYALADGGEVTFKFKNYGNSANNYNNYCVGIDTDLDGVDNALVRSDAYGWGADMTHDCSWWYLGLADCWATFREFMTDADVTLNLSRTGNVVVIDATIVATDGTVYTSKSTVTADASHTSDYNVFLTVDNSYIELKSVKVDNPETQPIDTVGAPDKSTGWWSDWSDSFELANGTTVTVKFNNLGGGANWNNYVLALVNVPVVGHSAPADQFPGTYTEYGVVRADAYGWGYESAAYETSWGGDWASWLTLMHDAEVTLAVTRSNGEVTIDGTYVGADDTVMTQKAVVNTTMTSDSECYFFLTVDGSYIELLSVETAVTDAVEEAVAATSFMLPGRTSDVSETDAVSGTDVVSETDLVSETDVIEIEAVSETDVVAELNVVSETDVAPVVTETEIVEAEDETVSETDA